MPLSGTQGGVAAAAAAAVNLASLPSPQRADSHALVLRQQLGPGA